MTIIEQWYCRRPTSPETHTVKRALHNPFTDCTIGTVIQLGEKFWAAEFKCGCKSLRGDERLGNPNTATTDENIAIVHQMVLNDHRIKAREVAEAMNVSKERVCHILNQHLGMRKLPARWVPCFLTLD
ncbi:histone-lysine N-methyltransferase SETMAR [Trichonephila clavipes]|nr:histone-lysine N-methyltransferase SETMAR [Trichonephila clavipes]